MFRGDWRSNQVSAQPGVCCPGAGWDGRRLPAKMPLSSEASTGFQVQSRRAALLDGWDRAREGRGGGGASKEEARVPGRRGLKFRD